MASPTTRFWLTLVTLIESLFSFFMGVFFSVWGNDLTSPVWVFIMSVPGGGRFWGTLFLIFGTLFLMGLEWKRSWPRVVGCAGTGVIYLSIGVTLLVAFFTRADSASGSIGIWLLSGCLTLCLAGFMYAEHRQEIIDERRKRAT